MGFAIEYSTDIETIADARHDGCCVHLLCLEGKCRLLYNNKPVEFGRGDAVILSSPTHASDIQTSADFRCEMVIITLRFIHSQLPANHYGIGGTVALFGNPVIPLSEEDGLIFHSDLQNIALRLEKRDHHFYPELMGSLTQTMVYDIFDFHAKVSTSSEASNYKADIVSRLNHLLASGRAKTERSVSYYARELHVTPKYLSDTIKQKTGHTVSELIDRAVMPLIVNALRTTNLTLEQMAVEFKFNSVSYLSRYIKKHLGKTPTEYRASLQPRK